MGGYYMVRKKELQGISKERLSSIKDLHEKGHYDLVVSESGLVVEMALKAAICKAIKEDKYPETERKYRIHEPERLVDLARLRTELDNEKVDNLEFFISWSLLSKWSISFRYMPIGSSSKTVSKQYITALDDVKGGVHPWIMKHW